MSLSTRTAFAAVALGAGLFAAQAFAAPPSWTVDHAASNLGFKSSFNGMDFEGRFKRWDAQIAFDPKDLAGSRVNATIDMASATTGDSSRDSSLPSDDWFATNQYPKATFTAAGFKSLGGDRYEANGTLTIRGVSKPVALPFTLSLASAANSLALSWFADGDFSLWGTTNLADPVSWSPLTNAVEGTNVLCVTVNSERPVQFFQLRPQ